MFVMVSALHVYTKAVNLKFGIELNDDNSGEECRLTHYSESLKLCRLDIDIKKKKENDGADEVWTPIFLKEN